MSDLIQPNDDDIKRIAEHFGCCYEGCERRDIWLIASNDELEGEYSFVCSEHVKMMATLETDEEREIYVRQLGHVRVIGGVDVSPN